MLCPQALFSDLLLAIATHASGFTQPKLDASHEQCPENACQKFSALVSL